MAEFVSASVGILVGGVVVWLWRWTGTWVGDAEFWPAFRKLANGLLAGEDQDDFFRNYAKLIRLLGGYLWQTSLRVGVVIVPVMLCLALLAPLAARYAASHANWLELYPPREVEMGVAAGSLSFGADGKAPLVAGVLGGPVRLATTTGLLELPVFEGSFAVCNSAWSCLGLQLAGLNAQLIPQGPDLLILRSTNGDGNILWPFLSDVEFAFWTGMLLSSTAIGCFWTVTRR